MITGQYFPIGSRVFIGLSGSYRGAYIQTINGLVPENEIKTYTQTTIGKSFIREDKEYDKKRAKLVAELNRAKVSKNKHLEKELTKRLEALC
jgi:hypothetical protein